MNIEDIKKAAEDFQPEIAELKHYDDVQLAILKKAEELKLPWPETKQFSEAVHKLKSGTKPEIKTASK